MKKHVLRIFVLSSWINVWAAKSFSRWTKLIDHEEISSKTCSECFSDSYSPLEFQFYKTPVFIAFLIFSEIYFFDRFYHYFHDFCSFFCNNLVFSWLFRNLEQIFRHLGFISGFGCFTCILHGDCSKHTLNQCIRCEWTLGKSWIINRTYTICKML